MSGVIYMFRNQVNGKRYVGQTWDYDRRVKAHIAGRGYAKLLKKAIEKYGSENFSVKVLYRCREQSALDKAEILLIKLLGSIAPFGYNIAEGGARGRHTESTKKLIGSYHKNKTVSPETRAKLSNSLKGRAVPDEVKEKTRIGLSLFHENKDKPVYFFDCFSHSLLHTFKNMQEVQKTITFPIDRVHGSLSAKSKFQHNKIYCYASYNKQPSYKNYSIGRKVQVYDALGNEMIFKSLAEATKVLRIKRGVMDSLVRHMVASSRYINDNGDVITFTAEYA